MEDILNILIVFILLIILVLTIYYIYKWTLVSVNVDRVLAPGLNSGLKTFIIPAKKAPNSPNGLEFTYSFWIFIEDWNTNYGTAKHILHRGTKDLATASPNVWLYPRENKLMIRFQTVPITKDNVLPQIYPSSTATDPNVDPNILNEDYVCDVQYVAIQKWMNVVISLNNRASDIYVDGKLIRSCILNGIPVIKTGADAGDIYLGGSDSKYPGFKGYIANFRYLNNAITASEAERIYVLGPAGNNSLYSRVKDYLNSLVVFKSAKDINNLTENTITVKSGNDIQVYNIKK